MHVLSGFCLVQLCVTLWIVACQPLLSMGFFRQEYWNVLLQGNLPDPETKPASLTAPTLAGGFLTTSTTWEALTVYQFQFSSVAQSCPALCDPMDCSTPGLPVHHQLLEFTQTHVHWGGDAMQPSHPLSCPSPPALNLSQHQGLFRWVSSSH